MEMTGTKMAALVAAAAVALPFIGVRGAFATPYTKLETTSINAVNHRAGDVKIADMFVVAPSGGTPTLHLAAEAFPHTKNDAITGLTVATDRGPVSPAGIPLNLPQGQLVNLTHTGLALPVGSGRIAKPGAMTTVTVTLKNEGQVPLTVPVVARVP